MNPPLPHFRYHPEPLASGSIEASAATCQCCGKARGYVYTGSPYSRHELPPGSLCPWCIADGSAAARYEASFSDDYPLLDAGVAANIVTEVCERTPGYASWQQERWLVCCEDACAFRGDAGVRKSGNWEPRAWRSASPISPGRLAPGNASSTPIRPAAIRPSTASTACTVARRITTWTSPDRTRPYNPICLPMISFMISREPPPMERIRLSRYSRSTRLSRM